MIVEADVDAGVGVAGQFGQGILFQHVKEGRVLGVDLRVAFTFPKSFDLNLGLQALESGAASRGESTPGNTECHRAVILQSSRTPAAFPRAPR